MYVGLMSFRPRYFIKRPHPECMLQLLILIYACHRVNTKGMIADRVFHFCLHRQ